MKSPSSPPGIGPKLQVFSDAHLWEQSSALGDEGEPQLDATMGREAAHVPPVEENPPTDRLDQALDDFEQRGCARAVRADDGEPFSRVKLQVDVREDLEDAVAGVERLDL